MLEELKGLQADNRLKLAIIMIVCAITISFTIASIDHLRQKKYIIENFERQDEQIEEIVIDSMMTIEKAYALFDQDTFRKMKKNTNDLLNKYEQNPKFELWDFDTLSKRMGMDIYIIDEGYEITHSNVTADVGLNFIECCGTLQKTLAEKRASGEFYEEGMDIEQVTGHVKKYTYMATADKKYIIQLGYNLQDGEIFNEFNFLTVIDRLVKKYPSINDIQVLNIGGLTLGDINNDLKNSQERKEAFKEALHTGETREVFDQWKNEPAIFRYVPYESEYDQGTAKNKVIEIVSNDRELQKILKENRTIFISQLVIVLIIISIIAFIIHKWVAKQVYLAYHDSLTRLKNRGAFDEMLQKHVTGRGSSTALMMIDLDNFKLVNDYLGHAKGDYLLKLVGKTIDQSVKDKCETFRIGGDEFAVIIPQTDKEECKEIATKIIESLKLSIQNVKELENFHITSSIGIAFAPEHTIYPETLYKKADIALYAAKEKGKNRYELYQKDVS